MTRPRSLLHPQSRRAAAVATVLFASGAAHSVAQAEETCTPACAPGQVCYQRTCMVPAPPGPAGPPRPAGPPAPAAPATPSAAPPASAPSAPGGYPPAPQAPRPGYGYPPQQPGYSYPPSGYSAPPASGYPVQQYPAQQYPAQQYPAQQYPAQQYPAQQYPAQQYPAQQYPAQQYPYGYQPPPPRRSRLVLLPFLGVHSFVGKQVEERSVGGMIGGLLGFHLSPVFSLAGELSFDVLNFNDNTQYNRSGFAFVLAVVPQFHIVAPTFEIIVGPKIGLWIEEIHSNYDNYDRLTDTASGLAVGLNAGIFFPVGRRLSLGGLLTFDLRPFNRICYNTNTTNESCSGSGLPDALKMWGLAGALLF